jgi:transcription antitermination factor NusG
MVAERKLEDKSKKLNAEWKVFHPVIAETQRWSRNRTRVAERPYFPGYIFVGSDDGDDSWRHISYVRGIKDHGLMLRAEDKPATVCPLVMSTLIDRCDVVEVEQPDGTYWQRHYVRVEEADLFLFRVGSRVKVTEGPFAAFEARVEWSSAKRVQLLLNVFGRQTKVEVAPKQLELVKV